MKASKITLSAILTALALCLSLLERFIPLSYILPLPGVKIGLANLVTLFALYYLGFPQALVILILRCLLGSIFSGSLTSLAYSLTGGILSLCVSKAVKNISFFSVYGVSVLGAASHSIGQIIAASALLGSLSPFGYLSPLLMVSVLTGLIIGSVCSVLLRSIPKIMHTQRNDAEAAKS